MKNKATVKRVVISMVIVVAWVALASMTGTRRVSASTFTVINLNDSGAGSLRQAMLDANATAGADTIDFAVGLTGTIVLASALPQMTDNLSINGPGAGVLTVSGNSLFRVFNIAGGVTVSISGLTISNGYESLAGGGIINAGTLTITSSTISSNTATFGGGICNAGTLTITNSNLSGNFAVIGGGIENIVTLTISSSTLSDNSALGPGGGIENQLGSTATVTSSTFSGNSAAIGGGIDNFSLATLTVTNSTFSGNSANGGGAIDNTGPLTVVSSTFSGNSAAIGRGGGIEYTEPPTVKNSIIGNSPSGGNCSGFRQITPVGVNFSTDNSCSGFTQVTAAQLNVGPLHDNGGPTKTHALLSGSVAIDAVTDCTDLAGNLVAQDQRGMARPIDGNSDGINQCDVGPYEEAPAFDICLQDDRNGSLLQFNSTTGDYQFTDCRKGVTLSGIGKVTNDPSGCKIALQDMGPTPKRPDRSVLVQVNRCTHTGTASIRIFSTGSSFSITDGDITNNTCACGATSGGVIYGNFGPGMAFDANPFHGWTINGFLGPGIGQQAIAHQFTPAATKTFTGAQVALTLFSGPGNVSVFLQADSNGFPGPVLEQINLTGLTIAPTIFAATSVLRPQLHGGTPYWLTVVAGGSGVLAGWNWNSIGDSSTGSNFAATQGGSPAGPWGLNSAGVTRSAFQINGSP